MALRRFRALALGWIALTASTAACAHCAVRVVAHEQPVVVRVAVWVGRGIAGDERRPAPEGLRTD